MELQQSHKTYHTDHSIMDRCQYHVIFCPKYRRKVLIDAVAVRLKERVLSKQAEYGDIVMEMEVLPEHGPLLLDVDPRAGINVVVGKIKGFTSHELRNEFPWLKKRLPTLWTRSTCSSTVGAVTLAVVQQDLEQQKNV